MTIIYKSDKKGDNGDEETGEDDNGEISPECVAALAATGHCSILRRSKPLTIWTVIIFVFSCVLFLPGKEGMKNMSKILI